MRITAFGMRAAFTKSDSLSDNKTMIIAQSVIYSIGYFGVLSSAVNLVIDRYALVVSLLASLTDYSIQR